MLFSSMLILQHNLKQRTILRIHSIIAFKTTGFEHQIHVFAKPFYIDSNMNINIILT